MNNYQRNFCLVDEVLGANAVNRISCVLSFKKEINISIMQRAIELTCQSAYLRKKYDAADTAYTDNSNTEKLSSLIRFSSQEELDDYIEKRKSEPIDWHDTYLLGIEILICEKRTSLYCWFHHMMYDGLSLNLVLDNIVDNYCRLLEVSGVVLLDFEGESLSENISYSSSVLYETDRDFWREKIRKMKDVKTFFSTDLSETRSSRLDEFLDVNFSNKIEEYCNKNSLTKSTFFLAVTALLVKPFFESDDLCIGVSLHNRKRNQMNKLGMVLNTVPLIIEAKSQERFSEFIRRTNTYLNEAYRHRAFPQKDMGFSPQVLYSYQINNFASDTDLFRCEWLFSEETTIPLAISIDDIHRSGGHKISLDYRLSDINNNYAQLLLKKFISFCHILIKEDCLIHPNSVITPSEKNILTALNQTKNEYPLQTVTEMFDQTAQTYADKIALRFQNKDITYAELSRQACRGADYLMSLDVRPNDIIAIVFDKSLEMIYAIWGILKAGAAYLPIDPQCPQERMEMICATAKVKYMITNAAITAPEGVTVLEFARMVTAQEQKSYPAHSLDDILYVIFTSGTTGVPKGVCVSHRNIMNLAHDRVYGITDKDRYLQIINYTFDVSVMGYIIALMQGATLVIAEDSIVLDPQLTANMVASENITVLNTTTALLNQWLPYLKSFAQIRSMMTGGEKLTASTANQTMQFLKGKLINAYGPTECTVFSTVQIIEKNYQADVPIGKPAANTTVTVLNKHGCPASINEVGELCIGGDGVALGYLNNETETQKYFVKNPFGEGTLYKTGDLCLVNEQGLIEYRGRKDNQVKIRGYRIEISEIENVLSSADSIKNAAVVAEDSRIIAYICPSHDIEIAELVAFLQKKLPSYMIPSIFKVVSEIPLTPNGKTDKKSIEKYVVKNTRIDISDDSLSEDEKAVKTVFVNVLGFKEFSIYDNFFTLGGSSLDAMKAVSEIKGRFQYSLKVSDFYKNSTVEALAGLLNGSQQKSQKSQKPVRPLSSTPVGDGSAIPIQVPTTPAQAMLYSIWNMDKLSTSYNTPVLIKLKRNIETNKLEQFLTKLVETHEVLRSRIIFEGDDIVQKIDEPYQVTLKARRLWSKDFSQFVQPFDLNNSYSMRATLISRHSHRYLLLDFHHCFIDGVSILSLLRDLDAFYDDEHYSPHHFCYSDYAKYLHEQDTTGSAAFWRDAVRDTLPANIDSRINRKKPSAGTGVYEFRLNDSLPDILRTSAKRSGISIHNYVLACFTVLLTHYNNEGRVALGTVLSGRTDQQFDNSVGMYVNTIPIVFEINKGRTVREHIQNIVEFLSKAYDHQSYGFNNIVKEADIQRNSSRNPLFDIMFITQNTELSSRLGDIVSDESLKVQEKFDLTVEAKILDDMTFKITYKRELYDELTIRLLAERFRKVLCQISNSDTTLIKDISMLTELDIDLLSHYNQSNSVYPETKTVSQCMLETAQAYSRRKAVIKDNVFITYRELFSNAKKIACLIQEKGYGRNDIIGLYCVRSIEMIEAMWGIILSGAAYMPIEIDAPKTRIEYMLQQGSVRLVLTFGLEASILPETYTQMDISEIKKRNENEQSSYMKPNNMPKDLVYVMFTSGSTGNPKGVQIEHRNVVEFILGGGKIKSRRFLSITNYAFDPSVYDIFTPLLTGGSLTVLDKEEAMDPSCIARAINNGKIHSMFLPASLFNMFTDRDLMMMKSLRWLYIGGERLSPPHVKRGLTYLPGKLFNGYGPTETTVFSITHKIQPSDVETDVPIGRPLNTTKIHILDENNRLCPVGVTGQIHIAGDGVAKGYLHPTDSAFTKFKVDVDKGERTYASGDRGRWNTRGLVDYFGRTDNQVKFRGFRIELDEIQKKILELKNIEDAAVLVWEKNQNKEIYAYYVTRKDTVTPPDITTQDIDDFLKQDLPEYMVPRFYSEVECIPLNVNGKVDAAALGRIPVTASASKTFEETQSETEKRIAEIWKHLFNVEISRNDDFFKLGGHSIQAIRFISEMKKDGVEINVKDVMDNSNLVQLAKHIDQMQSNQLQSALKENTVFHIEPHATFKRISQYSAEKVIFVFPTYMLNIAYALTFTKMADTFDSYSLYLGNFTNSENYVEEYTKEFVKQAKKYKEVWLFGYSFGGSLAYEVAQLAQSKGINIEGIIMLDSFYKENANVGFDSYLEELRSPEGFRNYLENQFEVYKELENSVKESIESCFLNFLEHTSKLVNKKKVVDTAIHYLRAEHQELDVQDTRDGWKQGCSEIYKEYTGYGKHNDMLNFSNLSKNVEVVSSILS